MPIRNELKGGNDFIEEGLRPETDLNTTFNAFYTKAYADNTGGTHSGDTNETDLATVTVLTADFNSDSTSASFLISAGIKFSVGLTGSITGTFRLKIGGATVKTIQLNKNASITNVDLGTSFNFLASAQDLSSSNIIVKITGQDSNGTTPVLSCEGLTVVAINNNS